MMDRLNCVCPDGEFLLIDKPLGWTSFDVVARIRTSYKKNGLKRKVGHCGTLDPLATGLLMLATGKKTKEISSIEILDKEYTGAIKLGVKTPSYDGETEEFDFCETSHLTSSEIHEAARQFLGKQQQKPPMFSATWHKGKRLYEHARQGKDIPERKSKDVEVFAFDITGIELPIVRFRLQVTKGTYVRSIANDFGERLGVGGYLTELRRTKIGDFSISQAETVSDILEKIVKTAEAHQANLT
ncbi:tRNA pseudouridine synthase B [Chloroherpeton thalassium ATCC 35110]|uniref:tRNA pseudouridine synthase B n=1 Tax=Chloroherpeton thalassium (strain ATCC 35110 / GB-78) TaxID=517418 RepID=TRUB_CHLT3|nr:tRNA pseudouridine(55) synthase TruB [Chloroherpeton thalassium]B3QZ05.1 RecName: Full=tRNA pseudouridine synthase B; AltName: Full=tRNA pseudouridine(55) synthase; Short=Psi55 synthase; AltName: Full=tRNA pseudouridylate synthase; AltName: Full=tRNA-uridine isomerase [Chloroherpeton thalassium ATCC 35110]ACF13698.1 tRNA pseudouridine synthase B [Chloroherpeton thalassium ATCC 35110]